MTPRWLPDPPAADQHGAFRASFETKADGEATVRLLGASWFVAWVDGVRIGEGPARFPRTHPEVQEHRVKLAAGRHVLALHATYVGVSNRLMIDLPPFVMAEVDGAALTWKCLRLDAHAARVRRVNAQLGWMEWWDTRDVPADWQGVAFDDRAWPEPATVDPKLGPLRPLPMPPVGSKAVAIQASASGVCAETFGYEHDDAPARFFLRDLAPRDTPPQGVWRRYDLGRVRLGRPSLELTVPAGAAVEMAVCEATAHGRVTPWITLSASSSANLWHYVARGGRQRIEPLVPLGGRYLEVHILADPAQVTFHDEAWLDRGYYGAPEGALSTGDRRLDAIWKAGIETCRACAEDAMIDNPTRERGAWTGDAVSAGLDIAGVAYSDLRLVARSLRQAAWTARDDGLVPGMAVGDPIFIPAYAAQWVSGCLRYVELSGDREFLAEMHPYAEKNLAAFAPLVGDDGLRDGLGWSFIDWGYVRGAGKTDLALNLHYLAALKDMQHWCQLLGKMADRHQALAATVEAAARRTIDGAACADLGYHGVALGLRAGLFGAREKEAVGFVKAHLLAGFPNDPKAPRLSDPGVSDKRLITPYFAHYAFPPLIERGETDFVLDQIRRCWGWMLESGHTTILEVFDTRWSHCHAWSACPTWQLSRYLLGLRPRFDRGVRHYDFVLHPGSLRAVSGRLPLPDGGGTVEISWKRTNANAVDWRVRTPRPLHVQFDDGRSVTLEGAARMAV